MPYCYFETKNLRNHSYQRPSVKLKMDQNKWAGALPQTQLGELTPDPTGGAQSDPPDPLAGL